MKRKMWVGMALAAGLVLLGVGGNWGLGLFRHRVTEVHLAAGKTGQLRTLGLSLSKEGVIPSERLFRYMARLTKSDRHLQSGIYRLDSRMGLWHILGKLRRGEVERVSVLVKEGDDSFDIAEAMVKSGACESTQVFREALKGPDLLKSLEKRFNPGVHLLDAEGFLYPDTYSVKKGEGAAELIALATAKFESELAKPHFAWRDAERAKGHKVESFYFYLKAASLIEKETATLSERPLVSSVLHNRLKMGERLRFDPTILYALKREGLWAASLVNGVPNIHTEHFTLRSKWNTYMVAGLPAGPICCPTLSSLKAACEPAHTDYLFFVAKGRSSKEHNFSKTYAEHQKLTQKYLSTP